MNVSARVAMKNVANCDTHCELRSSGNQQDVERMRQPDLQVVSRSVFYIYSLWRCANHSLYEIDLSICSFWAFVTDFQFESMSTSYASQYLFAAQAVF